MLQSYEAIVENGQVIWVGEQPTVQSARVIVTVLETAVQRPARRTAAAVIAGKGRTVGDLVGSIVDESDWECLK
jgi:hypothetical protein